MVLSGSSTLSLLTATLQQLNRVFELHLGPWGPGQTGFVALPSHPADSPIILQLQFLFDVLQKTLSLKVLGGNGADVQRAQENSGGGDWGCGRGFKVCRAQIRCESHRGGCAKEERPRKGRCAGPQ